MLPNALRCRVFLQLGWRLTLLLQGYGGQAQTPYKNWPSCRREVDDFLFASTKDVGRRDKSYFYVFLGAGNQVAAATQVELMFNILAMALDRFDTQVKRTRDLAVAKP